MDLTRFTASLKDAAPPSGLGRPLASLWYVAKGDWDRAHRLAQEEKNRTGAWVHAHLHRVEGDEANAAYWYGQAKRSPSTASLKEEWEEIAAALLAR
jgi:hypothetical protein